jgi:hypothetical protein
MEAEILGSKIIKAKGLLEDSVIGSLAFTGKFTKNKTQGQTTLENSNLIFNGQFKANKANGIGILKLENGLYVGEWVNNLYHGYGRLIKSSLAVYEGFFYKGMRKGLGVEVLPKGEIYIGEFKDDAKNGLGIYFFGKGGLYYGFFKDGKREGFGVLIDKHCMEIYRGYWKDSKKWGRGVEHFSNGAKYDGFFVGGKREGCGMMEFSKQLTYIGMWKDSKKHGYGKVDSHSGEISGKFFEDSLVEGSYVNPSKYYDQLMKNILPKSVEAYIKNEGVTISKRTRQTQEDLGSLLSQSLTNLVFGLCGQQQFRLHVYLVLRTLLGSKLDVDQVITKMGFFLMHLPNITFPLNVWEPKFDEFLGNKKDFSWNYYKIILDEKYESMEVRKSRQLIDLAITHKIVKGKVHENSFIEGTNAENGSVISFFDQKGVRLQTKKTLYVYPFFLLIESQTPTRKMTRRVSFNEAFAKKLENILEDPEEVDNSREISNEMKLEKMLKKKRIINFDKDFLAANLKTKKGHGAHETDLEGHDIGILLSKKAIFYQGEFFFSSEKKMKKKISMMLNIDTDGRIYSVGRDSVGSFLIVGSRWSDNSAQLIQKYFDEYEIEYKCFLFSDETIQGNWTTTNMKGGFVLRRDHSVKLTDLIVPALDSLFPSEEKQREVPLSKLKRPGELYSKAGIWAVENFKEFLEGSILAVIVRGAQGGIPMSETEEKEKILDERLFEEYRKMNQEPNSEDEDEKRRQRDLIEAEIEEKILAGEEEENFNSNSEEDNYSNEYETINLSEHQTDLRSIMTKEDMAKLRTTIKRKSMLSNANDLSKPEMKRLRQSRASFSMMNEDIRNRLDRLTLPNGEPSSRNDRVNSLNSELEETRNRLKSIGHSQKKSHFINSQNSAFLNKLTNIIGNLRKVSKNEEEKEIQELLTEECFCWKGELVTLGKTEDFVISNLFILKDRIEGTYNDADRLSYELAGSFSLRTNEFEIIGMSNCKSRSIKFKGSLNAKFELEGTLTSRPLNQTASNLKLKMLGVSAKAELFELEEGKLKREIPVLIKKTAHLIYGIIKMDNSYMFMSGVKGKNGLFSVEIMSRKRFYRGMVLTQEILDVSESGDEVLKFKNKKIHLTIKY